MKYIPANHEPTELLVHYWQPHKVGVFLDLSCDRGLHILDWVCLQGRKLFNSSYIWLLWSPEASTLPQLEDSGLAADSNLKLVRPGLLIYEVYKMHVTTETIYSPLSIWNSTYGHQSIQQPSKRDDFKGFVFNATLMMVDIKFNESNLIPPLLDKTYESGKDMVRRYGLAVFLHLAEMYNFRYNYFLTDSWGDFLPNGTVPGMVGQVMRGEVEFGLAPAKFYISRYNTIDYISSLHIVRVTFTFLQPKLFGSSKALILPLDSVVWYCLAGIGVLSIISFRILGKYDKTGLSNDNWGGSFLLVIGAITQQGIPDNTEKVSTRIVYVFLLFLCFFTAAYYNTAILNGLLLQAPNAIQNIEQLLKSDIKLGMVDIPYFYNEMRQNDTLSVRVREKILKSKQKKVFFNFAEGVAKIKKGKFALYTEDESVYTEILRQMTDAEVCSVSEVTKYNPFHVGAIAKKHSPYKEHFNRAFSLMRERGILNRQLEHWLVKKPECHWRQDALTLGLEPLALAYAAYLAGFLGSLCLLGIELLLRRRQANQSILKKFKIRHNSTTFHDRGQIFKH
nr:ionotropic receptor 75q [Tropidothorax elegans]